MGDASRLIVWMVGGAFVVAAAWVLWTMTPVADVVPWGVFLAVVLLIIGLAVMGAASQIRGEDRVVREERRV